PHPFLARHIVASADADPELVARVLEACRIAPGQRRVGEKALAELQARELAGLARRRAFSAAVELQGRWLPGKDTDNALLKTLAEAARFFAAAQGSTSPYLARQHLDTAEQKVAGIDNQRLASKETLAGFLPDTLAAWRAVLAEMRAENQQAAAEQLPNPFITVNPLSNAQPAATDLFRGREAIIRQVETLLGGDQASLALIGPRRCGKSSLINMFKVWLPDTQVVLFDLQDNSAGTPAGFYRALAEQTRRQAYQDRRLGLPVFPEGAPIEALRAWLDELEAFPGVDRFLICIDEFERLPKLFPGKEQDLLQFMGLLRATIQHRRRVRLLVAGAAPFNELDRLWSDHFINLREIRIGYLDAPTCVGLLTRPVEKFPADAVPEEVARAVVARTGGQPFLVQLYGSLLVDRLNEAKRKTATLDDVEPVEQEVLDQASNYFRNLWGDLPPAAHPVLRALDAGQSARADAATQHWLRRRLIVSEEGVLLVPVFARWVRENVPA
ncbi:MAG: ATP-binding protein, partial [Gammaproteobacteria bacterium]|nr:ATP-binding protein [Gammaproteobacteria bacterium]